MRRVASFLAVVSLLSTAATVSTVVGADETFPDVIQLPLGFRPEGITHGRGDTLYVDNFDHGAIFRVDAHTGAGHFLVPASADHMGVGIKFDRRTNSLFTAGGSTGKASVWNADTGTLIADFVLASTDKPTFINDLIIDRDVVYFTDSFRPVVYALHLGRDGQLPPPSAVKTLPLTGDYRFVPTTDPTNPVFNGNGIEITPDRDALVIMNSKTGLLYTMDPETGSTEQIDLGGVTLPTCDGFLRLGQTLYVVQNTNNIAVIRLDEDFKRGTVERNITNPHFDTLATAAFLDGAIYVTNPRFQVASPDGQPFSVVRVPIDR